MITRLLPFLLILISIGIFFLYVNPTYTQDVLGMQKKISSYDKALGAAKDYTSRENNLIAQENQIPAQNLTRLATFLPDDVDNVQLILDLSNLASRSGVSLSGFSISRSDSSAGNSSGGQGLTSAVSSTNLTDSLDVTVNVTGSYNNFRNFLRQTEQSLRLLDVTNMTISSSGSGYTYGITFRLYWLH